MIATNYNKSEKMKLQWEIFRKTL